MDKGISLTTKFLLRQLDQETLDSLEFYVGEMNDREFLTCSSAEEVENYFGDKVDEYIESLSSDDMASLREYTGYFFRFINNVMRGKWNYQENGELTREKQSRYLESGQSVKRLIHKFPKLNTNFKTYRGVSLRAFQDYGITQLEDLVHMQGKYLYEKGFSSTSVVRSHSFFEQKQDWAEHCNIEIEFLIPEESRDGALLLNDNLSYSEGQLEYVLNSDSLFKITSVKVDPENNRAYLMAVLIPKILWDPIAVQKLDEETRINKK